MHPDYQGQGIAGEMLERIKEKYKNYLYIEGMPEDKKMSPSMKSTAFSGWSMVRPSRSATILINDNHRKGDTVMKIAVPYENGQVFQHFGHSAQFKIYDTENGKILSSEIVSTNGQGHGALVGFLVQNHVNVVLCGGIGAGAQTALAQAGIQLFGGISGNVDAVVSDYLAGHLVFDPNAHCDHHDHDEGHTCGSHSCHEDKGDCAGSCR